MTISLEKIRVAGYRSCVSCEFDLRPELSALIGPNGSGKTNLLRSLILLRTLALEHDRRSLAASLDTSLKVWLRVDGKSVIHTIDARVDTDEQNRDHIIGSKQSWYMKEVTGTAHRPKWPVGWVDNDFRYLARRGYFIEYISNSHRVVRSRLQEDDSEWEALALETVSKIADYYRGFTYYSASQFTDPSQCPVSIDIDGEGKVLRSPRNMGVHARWLYDMYTASTKRPDSFASFESVVGESGIGLIDRFHFEEVPVSSEDYRVRVGGKVVTQRRTKKMVIPQVLIGSSVLSPSQLSEGTFRTLAMLFYILEDSGGLLLIEEPEVCIHHGLLSSVMEIICEQSLRKQIVVSTHSDYLLDNLDIDTVFVVRRDSELGTSVVSLPKYLGNQDVRALKHFLDTEGTLGEYWKMGGIDD